MIVQVLNEKGEAAAEILIRDSFSSVKILKSDNYLNTFLDDILNNEFIVSDLERIPFTKVSKVGKGLEKESFLILQKFEFSALYKLKFINAPKFEEFAPLSGVVL